MTEVTRKAFRAALKKETDPAGRQWLRLMLKGEAPPPKPRRRSKARAK
jgi:hypothetical protein